MSVFLSDHQEDTVNYSLTNDVRAPGWFETVNERQVPTAPPVQPVPCRHETTVEQLRSWLSRQPFDGRVVVGDVLLRLGRAPRGGA